MLLVHQVALVLAVAALAAAATRAAAALGARGLELPVAAAAIGAAAAGIEALALGRFGLGGSPVALLAAAALTYAAARRAWPAAGAWPALRSWWAGRGPRERLVLGALAGAGLAWVAWLVRHPSLGIDPLTYHLPESIRWVQHGRPGSVEVLQYEFPQGYYPVTNELLVAWLTGLSRSGAPGILWTPATAALAILAGWLGLRRIGAGVTVSALGIAAVLLTPISSTQLIGAHTDLPAIAWLWACAALVAAAERRPALLAPAVVAAALSVGTKTTAAPLVVLLLGWAAWRHRARLRGLAIPLAVAAVAAVGVGGIWYLRNLVTHGSPLWPFVAAPWGDPMPRFLAQLDISFLDEPALTLERHALAYLYVVAGGWLVLALGLLAPAIRPRRCVALATGVTLLALLSWMNAPFTGSPDDRVLDLAATTTRYLLPTLSAAAVALALAAGGGPRRHWAVLAMLAAACVWSIRATHTLPLLGMPSSGTLVAGALVGAAATWVLTRLRTRPPVVPRAVAAGVGVAAGALALTVVATDFAARQAGAYWLRSSGVVAWAAAQPAFREQDFPIAFAPEMVSTLAGDELQHPIELIGQHESCARIRRRIERGWVVLGTFEFADRREPFSAAPCLRTTPPGARVLYRDRHFTVLAAGRGTPR
ncbi:MAG TPA: hypothetical protein VM266_09210 [Solirubrobacteraceae bacterium]|nr:hypothetical protein [Solirubrobacteraceae bacterium]